MPYCRCLNHRIPGPHTSADCPMYDPDDPRISKGLPPYADPYREVGIGADNTTVVSSEGKDNKGVAGPPVMNCERPNPDPADYVKAKLVVLSWLKDCLHVSIAEQIPSDDGGQLVDMIAWALTGVRDDLGMQLAIRAAESDADLQTLGAAMKENARLRAALTEVLNLPENTTANAWDYRRQVVDRAREALADSRRASGASRPTAAPGARAVNETEG